MLVYSSYFNYLENFLKDHDDDCINGETVDDEEGASR
jgi:hypothetical protein